MPRRRPLIDQVAEYLESAQPDALTLFQEYVDGICRRRAAGVPAGTTAPVRRSAHSKRTKHLDKMLATAERIQRGEWDLGPGLAPGGPGTFQETARVEPEGAL